MFVVVALLACAQERCDCLQRNFEQSLFPLRESRAKRTSERACVENCHRVETSTRATFPHGSNARLQVLIARLYLSRQETCSICNVLQNWRGERCARVFQRSGHLFRIARYTRSHAAHETSFLTLRETILSSGQNIREVPPRKNLYLRNSISDRAGKAGKSDTLYIGAPIEFGGCIYALCRIKRGSSLGRIECNIARKIWQLRTLLTVSKSAIFHTNF